MKNILTLGILLLVSACAAPSGLQQGNLFAKPVGQRAILLMPLDVEVSVLTAGGVTEPNADWTVQATEHLTTALAEFGAARQIRMTDYAEPAPGSVPGLLHTEIRALHGAVGNAILDHKYYGINLPTKQEAFDWSLGPEVQSLKAQSKADYALFMYARDSFSSGARVALQIASTFLPLGVSGGTQVAFISLVDLNTGDISWFNYNFQVTGDIRSPEGATVLVNKLLSTLPIAGTSTSVVSR